MLCWVFRYPNHLRIDQTNIIKYSILPHTSHPSNIQDSITSSPPPHCVFCQTRTNSRRSFDHSTRQCLSCNFFILIDAESSLVLLSVPKYSHSQVFGKLAELGFRRLDPISPSKDLMASVLVLFIPEHKILIVGLQLGIFSES